MYFLDNSMMANNRTIIINPHKIAIGMTLIMIHDHFARNMSFILKSQIKMISKFSNNQRFHINIIKISNIIKFFIYFMFFFIRLFVYFWIFIFTHYWWLKFICTTCFTHSLHWFCVQYLICLVCYEWLLPCLFWGYLVLQR